MAITLAFDVYGTLIDTGGIETHLQHHVGDKASGFSSVWRQKQLEYSFRRGLMQRYETFAVCTGHALDYACLFCKTPLSQAAKQELLNAYSRLPPFAEVKAALTQAKAAGFRLFAFSNGTEDAVTRLLTHAGIRDLFIAIVSVDEIKTFKPHPAVYEHFLTRSNAVNTDTWLVSGNPFDVLGAVAAGMRAVWIQRSSDAVFDPWEIEPSLTLNSLAGLTEAISCHINNGNKHR
ncbi:MAG: haloacid dehalogenase type II [Gammaproteobacteria bacterium HGW-Gammaproteobacteria-3]|jgi:2-haloacid dehalogenase|nr:MAG: haloacid dehalogenase type II [Gammaproteobacteria bacterium HGW-Gammaproteobacteria-3]